MTIWLSSLMLIFILLNHPRTFLCFSYNHQFPYHCQKFNYVLFFFSSPHKRKLLCDSEILTTLGPKLILSSPKRVHWLNPVFHTRKGSGLWVQAWLRGYHNHWKHQIHETIAISENCLSQPNFPLSEMIKQRLLSPPFPVFILWHIPCFLMKQL